MRHSDQAVLDRRADMGIMQATPPGWYPDPETNQSRYWDGTQWASAPSAGPGYPPGPSAFPGGPIGTVPTPYGAVQPKNPAISLIVSFFLPGVGSMINGDTSRGVIILVSYIVGLILTIVLIGFVIAFGVWIWGMVDAYQGAQRWNAAHGIRS